MAGPHGPEVRHTQNSHQLTTLVWAALAGREMAELAQRDSDVIIATPLPDIAPVEILPAPTFHRVTEEASARIVASVALLHPPDRYAKAVSKHSGFSFNTVWRTVDEMEGQGFLAHVGMTMRPRLFSPTDLFNDHLRRVRSWRHEYNLAILSNRMGLDRQGTLDYLLRLGVASLQDRD